MHKAGTVFHSGIRFPRFLTFVLLALFVATSQANGRFQTAAAGCRSTGLAPLRGSLRAAPITFRCGWAGVPLSAGEIIARQLAKAAFGWMGTARHLIGPSLCRSNAFRTGGLRASSASLFHFWLIRLMSFSRWICTFQAARGGLKKIPSCGRQRERAFYAVFNYFFKKFFKREILREILYCFPYPICSKSDCVKP